ncbi:MBL fold metallo-hydrolase [Corynebacterium anserum]|uniref:MBL fold metallo-hydrolase n=1 Tax=Corynebacterium anserum TaxID=2684406 RepID=A0A7G7YNJ7_9CORY|nr:MBL fold metallo-hydrolase [Corynebacterium anserum]QNH96067.1 MBL fold metallo-hydrolase [Corynebacterium anserum]
MSNEDRGVASPLPDSTRVVGFVAGPLETNCYVLVDAAHTGDDGLASAVVIDPGMGAGEVVRQLAAQHNFRVERVVLTHGHIDHIRDAADFGVPVYVHPADRDMLNPQWTATSQFAALFDVDSMAMPSDIRDLDNTIEMGGTTWEIHHMPGHSPGSVMFRIPGLIIGGDVLFKGGVGRTDLPGSSAEEMLLSLKKLTHEFADDDVVLSGHGPHTTVGEEKRSNPFLQSVK